MKTSALILIALVLTLGGCGGDDSSDADSSGPDGASLVEAFNALAAQAYEDAGEDRSNGGAGILIDGCFAADDAAATAIGDAIGAEEFVFQEENFLQGVPNQEEKLLCAVEAPKGTDGPPPIVNVGVGTTTLSRDQLLERLLSSDDFDRQEVEGTADGLDPSTVLAADGGGVSQYIWVDGDFTVGISGPTDQLTPDEGFAALSAAVDGVESTLTE